MNFLRLRVAPLVAMLGVLFSISCSESDSEPEKKGTMTFTVDGEVVTLSDVTATVTEGVLFLRGETGQDEIISITVTTGIAEGTYALATDLVTFFYNPQDNGNMYGVFGNATGELTFAGFNEEERTMHGSFHATLERYDNSTDKIIISNGTFTDVPYTIQTISNANLYIAKVKGQDFRGSLAAWGGGDITQKLVYGNGEEILIIYFPGEVATPGTYAVGPSASDSPYRITYHSGLNSYASVSGTITISQHDINLHYIEGTYNVIVESYPNSGETIEITEGSFAVDYQN